jgi:sterol desaturase/sphingolipid hydroxylase (fatty acid hydroxylase superfamily)
MSTLLIIKRLLSTPGFHLLTLLLLVNVIVDSQLHSLREIWSKYVWFPALELFGDNASCFLVVCCTFLLHMTTFWVHSIILLIFDLNNEKVTWLKSWKVQSTKNSPIELYRIKKCAIKSLSNQFLVTLPLLLVFYPLLTRRGLQVDSENFPIIKTITRDFMVFLIIEEIGFYYGHRAMHTPLLYKRFHKIHHEWTSPIGMGCIYAHPVEHIACNLLPVVAGPLVMKSHLFTLWLWLTLAVFTTITHHSGYHVAFLSSPERHDFHHLKFNTNSGVLDVLDILHGTDEQFLHTVQEKRDYVFWNPLDPSVMRQGEMVGGGNSKMQ